jgi:nitroreductase
MTMKTDQLSFLSNHQSIPASELIEPAPDEQQLDAILQAAMSAPDHGNLHPFRFLIIQGDARVELSKVFEEAARNRNLDETAIQKQKSKPLRSPMIICVVARIIQSPKIPEIEQLLCAGCAAQHIQLACSNQGFGSIWLTGENCYDQSVYQALGLQIDERMVGFIYVGSLKTSPAKKLRNSARSITQSWTKSESPEFAI